MDNYEKLQYSKSQIKKAGEKVTKIDADTMKYQTCVAIIDNWRAVHAYPLDCIVSLITGVVEHDRNIYVVQRLKRLESIIKKLGRHNNTGLYKMQDLGGCRIIVPAVEMIYTTADAVRKALIDNGHEIIGETDYLQSPRTNTGYRSYHMIIRYHDNTEYDGLVVELQIRSKLEHSWATAVEIVDSITNDSLKSGTGDENSTYFFKLISALFSIKEGTPIVSGVPEKKADIVKKIYELDYTLNIRERLGAYNSVVKFSGEYPDDAEYYLLVTDTKRRTIQAIPFKRSQIKNATKQYQEQERRKAGNFIDVVLVAATKFDIIRECYPNYFMDTLNFLSEIRNACLEYPEKSALDISLNNKSKEMQDMFKFKHYPPNIKGSISVLEDGIGKSDGDLYFCPKWAISLDKSYLRFSGIILNERYMPQDDLESCNIVDGPGIIVAETGACFYIDKERWSFINQVPAIVIQCKEGTERKMLVFLISWLKTNLCTWDLLWNKHNASLYPRNVMLHFPVPEVSEKIFMAICDWTESLLKMENQFVSEFTSLAANTPESIINDKVDSFNKNVIELLIKIEALFLDHFGINDGMKKQIQQELRLKGYYIYE